MCRNDHANNIAAHVSETVSFEGTACDCQHKRRHLSSSALLGSANEIVIEHNGCKYNLRITRQNKLILTK